MPMLIGKELFCMERLSQNVGTRKDLVLHLIKTAKSDLNAEEYKGAEFLQLVEKYCISQIEET